jgi:DNA-directed RNA polymerase specialized sigma24 family protein
VPPAKAPSNDDAERVTPLDEMAYRALVSDPRVRAYLWARLGPVRIPRQEKEELIGAVFEVLWQRRTSRDPARTLARLMGLARTVLEGKLVDHWRHQAAVAEDIVDAPRTTIEDRHASGKSWEQPNYVDELRPPRSFTPEDSLHAKQQMQYVNEVAAKIGLTDDDVEVMFAITWDEEASYEELAAERGVKPGALRTRIHRLQKAVREGWERRVKRTLVLTLLLAMLLLYVLAAFGLGRRPPPPAPLPEPTVHEVAPVAPTATEPAKPDVPTGRKPRVR